MTKYEKVKRLNEKYGINIISESNGRIIYELNGYIYNIIKDGISRVRLDNPYFMVSSSYIKYLNDTTFKDTPIRVVEINGDYITYVNTETFEHASCLKSNINLDTMINITNKPNKYREEIIKVHGDKYNYDNCWPESTNDKVELECPVHGSFSARVANIIYNHSGCPGCANEIKGYTKHIFVSSCAKNNNGNGTLYLAKVTGNNEEFLKIGITSYPNTEKRFAELRRTYDNVTPVLEINSDPVKVYNLEHYIHKHFGNKKYIPLLDFNGRQECYGVDILEELINIICKKL